MTDRDLLQQALEYVERHAVIDGIPLRNALRERLARQECSYPNCAYPCLDLPDCIEREGQQPVAWQWLNTGTFRKSLPASAEPGTWRALYTARQREWEGLNRKEMLAIIDQQAADKKTGLPMYWRDQVADVARAIEAALKEKNA